MGSKKKPKRKNSSAVAKEKAEESGKAKTLDAKPLVDSLEATIHLLTKTYSLVDHFHSDAQEDLIDNLAKLIKSYKSVDENRNVLGDTKVPMEILDHIDRPDGKVNPTLFTKLKIETCLEERERMRKYQKCFDDVREKLSLDATDAPPASSPSPSTEAPVGAKEGS